MNLICPLCGKYKPEDSLFCDDCSKKINTDFEINIHESDELNEDKTVVEEQTEGISELTEEDTKLTEVVEKQTEVVEDQTKEADNKSFDYDSVENKYPKKSKKIGGSLFWVLIGAIILIVAFLIYNKTILSKTLEQRAWDTAVNENSVSGYLEYIESHPDGIHFDDAQAGLMKLKEDEANNWDKLKVSQNIDELVNFTRQYESSPYIPLVRTRIDSLSWISALKMNSVGSYSEYIMNSQSGLINGDYISEATKRYEMLFQSTPVNSADMDSIRSTINGFYASLSEINHTGMYKYLAPEVQRFYDSGGLTREKITGQLMVTAAQIGNRRFSFEPNLEGVKYARETNGSYKVNVPVVKSYLENGNSVHLPGYIAHIEMNTDFEITSIHESKPFPGSP
ncbi:MAG: hypothetical protein PHV53_05305 [Fermentimonas sp.]|nr:hypothetical protein [Fermentimonas sp.]